MQDWMENGFFPMELNIKHTNDKSYFTMAYFISVFGTNQPFLRELHELELEYTHYSNQRKNSKNPDEYNMKQTMNITIAPLSQYIDHFDLHSNQPLNSKFTQNFNTQAPDQYSHNRSVSERPQSPIKPLFTQVDRVPSISHSNSPRFEPLHAIESSLPVSTMPIQITRSTYSTPQHTKVEKNTSKNVQMSNVHLPNPITSVYQSNPTLKSEEGRVELGSNDLPTIMTQLPSKKWSTPDISPEDKTPSLLDIQLSDEAQMKTKREKANKFKSDQLKQETYRLQSIENKKIALQPIQSNGNPWNDSTYQKKVETKQSFISIVNESPRVEPKPTTGWGNILQNASKTPNITNNTTRPMKIPQTTQTPYLFFSITKQ